VLPCSLNRRKPGLAPLRPDLSLRFQVERSVIERPDPDFDKGFAGIGGVEET
jgi:hypothetical protein